MKWCPSTFNYIIYDLFNLPLRCYYDQTMELIYNLYCGLCLMMRVHGNQNHLPTLSSYPCKLKLVYIGIGNR